MGDNNTRLLLNLVASVAAICLSSEKIYTERTHKSKTRIAMTVNRILYSDASEDSSEGISFLSFAFISRIRNHTACCANPFREISFNSKTYTVREMVPNLVFGLLPFHCVTPKYDYIKKKSIFQQPKRSPIRERPFLLSRCERLRMINLSPRTSGHPPESDRNQPGSRARCLV